jgi:hypothetical protein
MANEMTCSIQEASQCNAKRLQYVHASEPLSGYQQHTLNTSIKDEDLDPAFKFRYRHEFHLTSSVLQRSR